MACQASSNFTINAVSLPAAVTVAHAATATFALVSSAKVASCSWEIVGKSRAALTYPTITTTGSPAVSASLIMPVSEGIRYGASFRMKCTVTDANGESESTYAVFGAEGLDGQVPPCAGEETDRSTVGWGEALHTSAQLALLNFTDIGGVAQSLAGGASLAVIGSYSAPVGSTLNWSARIRVNVKIWEIADKSVQGSADFIADARTTGSALQLSTVTETLGRLPAGSDAEIGVSSNNLTVSVQPTANNCYTKIRVWVEEIEDLT